MKQMDSLTERIYNEVLRDIRDGKIRPDEYIVEQDLCREFGISKGTAGDVLHRLAQDQIVLSYPRKGYKLNVYDEKEFRNIQTLRFSIESLVIHKLIQSGKGKQLDKAFADIDAMDNYTFHASLAAKTGDPFIIDALDRLVNKAVTTYVNISFDAGDDSVIASRHKDIIAAIVKGNEAEAIDALRDDLRLSPEDGALKQVTLWQYHRKFNTDAMKEMAYVSDPQITADGTKAAYVQTVAHKDDGEFYPQIRLLNLETGEEYGLDAGTSEKNPRFAPDGSYFAYLSDETGEFQIYIAAQDGKARQLTHLRHGVNGFEISPDGEKLVFTAKAFPAEIEAGNVLTEMTEEEKAEFEYQKEWGPKEITEIDYKNDSVFGVRDGSISVLGLADVSGEVRIIADDMPYLLPAFSPDSKKIAVFGQPYKGVKFSRKELFLLNTTGKRKKQVTNHCPVSADVPPVFTEDGSGLVITGYYFKDGGMAESLYLVPAAGMKEGDKPVCLFDYENGTGVDSVYGLPACRTQLADEKPFVTRVGDEIYFLSAYNGNENLYKIKIQEKSTPELVLGGEYSIHEFCAPVNGTILVTAGTTYSLRELYLYDPATSDMNRLADNNPWLKEVTLGQVESMTIPTKDGKGKVHGWVCKPVDFEEGVKYPAVLYLHGGPQVTYTNDFWHEIQILANEGFAVVYCDPRGSSGYGIAHCNSELSWGQEAYDDLMGFLDAAIEKGFIDPERVGITGGSYGGYMTCKIIMMTDRFKAAVGQRVFVNKATSYGTGDMGFYSMSMDPSKVNIERCLIERARTSIIKDMDKIKTPLLLLHGYKDYRCSFEQSEQMFISMHERRKDVPVRLVMFPGENHNVSRTGLLHHQQKHVQEMVDWFNRFLKEGVKEGE